MRVTEKMIPYLGFETYVRIVQPDAPTQARPLLLLHGGPGSTHTNLELLDPLADRDGITIISYDQLGCGNSWDDAMAAHPELWCKETWLGELRCLIDTLDLTDFHLLGQSWGGMLALLYLIGDKPSAVRSVVLSSTLADAQLWGKEGHRRFKYLTPTDVAALTQAEETGSYDSSAYTEALKHYMELFCAGPVRADDPEPLRRARRKGDISYQVAWGPNEFTPTGTLSTYNVSQQLSDVICPALIISGTEDLSSPIIAKQLFDGIPRARWELMSGCRHMCFADDTPRYLNILSAWLGEKDL
ncbi:MAG: proline iminopeptidase-family hydrolase [Atopobiaceae bacterium]|jgi:proline iminopeptidase